jgi:hypothetical protein
MGQSGWTIGSSCQTATRKTASEAIQNAVTCARESRPDGSSRAAVRGLRASISASISRFWAMARLRAPTMARVTHPSAAADGTSPTDRIAPTKANGSANTVCSNLTSETNRRAVMTVVTDAPWAGR